MSNIIDGIPYGMGYEKATEPGESTQYFDLEKREWMPRLISSEPLIPYIAYRRPLPIISQHPEAIPLEPGEELVEGECYLMRDGRLTGPMPYDGHDAYPFGIDGTPDTWRRDGCCWDNSLSRNDIVARLPKVEKKEPEKTICDLTAMAGKMGVRNIEQYLPEPKKAKKAKEEKVEEQIVEIPISKIAEKTVTLRLSVAHAALFAQLHEVIAEVERQRKESEIKVGDWVRHKRDALIFKVAYADDRGRIVRYPDGVYHYGMENLEKIQDHDLIEMLEKGVGNG